MHTDLGPLGWRADFFLDTERTMDMSITTDIETIGKQALALLADSGREFLGDVTEALKSDSVAIAASKDLVYAALKGDAAGVAECKGQIGFCVSRLKQDLAHQANAAIGKGVDLVAGTIGVLASTLAKIALPAL